MKIQIKYFSGTHWDREWYQTYQGFRFELVDVIDELIDVLEKDKEYKVFHLDGQTIVLDDYLEIKPYKKERLLKLIKDGRILIGPWYTMPDEQIVNGESIIRNLIVGHQKAKQYGTTAWKCGYICDIFGHIAQMPQIFNGFNINTCVLGRGTVQEETGTTFIWNSSTNNSVLVYKIPEYYGYGSFAAEVVGERSTNIELDPNSKEFEEKCRAYIDREIKRASCPVIVLFDAMDHESPHPQIPHYIKKIKEFYPECDVEICDLNKAFKELEKYKDSFKKVTGELLRPAKIIAPFQHLLEHTLSSRYDVKYRNAKCETLLFAIESLMVYNDVNKLGISGNYLKVLWELLLANHAHDSICGCSRDRIHSEMHYRFSQIESFYESLSDHIVRRINNGFSVIKEGTSNFSIFNPLPYEVTKYIKIQLPFEKGYPFYVEPFGYENILAFELYDKNHNKLEYDYLELLNNVKVRTIKEQMLDCSLVTIGVKVTLNPFGFTSFEIASSSMPTRQLNSFILDGETTMDNGSIRVSFNLDGTYNVFDYKTNEVYKCGLIIDDSEIGDGWNSSRVLKDNKVVSSTCDFEIINDGPVSCTIRCNRHIKVPTCVNTFASKIVRSNEYKSLELTQDITIVKGSNKVLINIQLDNNVLDHRLRYGFNSNVTSNYHVSQAFTFVDRKCGIDKNTLSWKEVDSLEKSTSGIVYKEENNKGLIIYNRYGVKEVSGLDNQDGSIYFTLIRCFNKTHTSLGEEGGELQGKHNYEFALEPISSKIDELRLQKDLDTYRSNEICFVSKNTKYDTSLINIESSCISCLKPTENKDGIAIRLYNPSNKAVNVKIEINFAYKLLIETDMLENKINDINNEFCLKANEIKTLVIK